MEYKPVREYTDEELRAIVSNAPANFLLRTPHEKDAKRELMRREGTL